MPTGQRVAHLVEPPLAAPAAFSIAEEFPLLQDVDPLFQWSDACAASLYPPESRHGVDPEELAAADACFLVARIDGAAVACAGLVFAADGSAELKRLYVDRGSRGLGVARALVHALEHRAEAAGASVVRLETGIYNEAAIRLYERAGYRRRGPFGAYGPDPNSVFLEKGLGSPA